MTLRNSFWTSQKENFKRRIGSFGLFGMFLLFVYPIRIAMIMSTQIKQDVPQISLQKDAISYMGFDTASVLALSFGAVVCALQGFQWLYNRKKVDMYGAQPISMAKRYFITYENGIFLYFIPHIIAKLLSILVISTVGCFSSTMLAHFGICLIAELLYYLAVYHITLVSIMLCGHSIVAILATGCFLTYEMLLRMIFDEYQYNFFVTYTYQGRAMQHFISPLIKGMELAGMNYGIWDVQGISIAVVAQQIWAEMLSPAILLLLVGAATGVLAFWLYKKRPMEASEVAIAFPAVKGPVKIAICFLVGLLGGLGFFSMSGNNYVFALIGLASGLIVSQFVVEIIFHFDIKAIFCGRKSFAAGCVLATGLFMVFWLDLLQYDRFVPKEEQIESASILLEFDHRYSKDYTNSSAFWEKWNSEYEFDNMKLHDTSAVLALAGAGMGRENVESMKKLYEEEQSTIIPCTVAYQMKNGKTVRRKFYVDYVLQEETLNALFAQREYKEGADIILDDKITELFSECEASYYNGFTECKIPNDRVSDMLKDYQADYADMTFSDVKQDVPYGLLQLSYKENQALNVMSFPVYTTYQRTIEDLKNCDIALQFYIDPQAVGGICVTNYACDEESVKNVRPEDIRYYSTSEMEAPDYIEHTYEEQEQIQKILESACCNQLARYCYIYKDAVVQGVDLELQSAQNDMANQYNWYDMYMQLRSGQVPEFVKNDMGIIQEQ